MYIILIYFGNSISVEYYKNYEMLHTYTNKKL